MKSAFALLSTVLVAATALSGCMGSSSGPAGLDSTGSTPTPDTGADEAVPKFALEGIEATPEKAGIGDVVTVKTTLVNIGTEAGTAIVVPLWNGQPVSGSQEIDMLVGKRKDLTFEIRTEGPAGNHFVGLQVAGAEPLQTVVEVVAPAPRVTDWTVANPLCEPYLQVALTVTNTGGSRAEGYTLDVYSYNQDDVPMGHANFTIPALGPGEDAAFEDSIFAPHECGTGARYTLEFIVTDADGAQEHRERTEPFFATTGP